MAWSSKLVIEIFEWCACWEWVVTGDRIYVLSTDWKLVRLPCLYCSLFDSNGSRRGRRGLVSFIGSACGAYCHENCVTTSRYRMARHGHISTPVLKAFSLASSVCVCNIWFENRSRMKFPFNIIISQFCTSNIIRLFTLRKMTVNRDGLDCGLLVAIVFAHLLFSMSELN